MALMDEACLVAGKTTDKMLLEAMDGKLKAHKHYLSRTTDAASKNKHLEFHRFVKK